MKIIGIRFQNLNSLKGTHEIRFDQSPFLESGLFAITGPTGAGKTTILDAITVALYGKVHRHDRDAFEIMTRHTSECYAEVEFEAKQKAYRARWSLRRSRGKLDGKLQDVKMELSEVETGKLLESKLTEVKNQIVELTGLDYSQFLRSVMLSQGDFTRFLKASESERSELLEKITDTGVYSQISMWAFEKAKAERKKLEELRAKLNDVVLLSPEEQTGYQQQLQELHIQENNLKQTQRSLETQINWRKHLHALENKKHEIEVNLISQQEALASQQFQFERLQRHHQAVTYRPALTEIQSTKKYCENITQTLQQLTQQIPEQQKQVSIAEINFKQAQESAEAAARHLNTLQPILEKVIQLDSTLASNRLYYEQALTKKERLTADGNQSQALVQQKQAELNQLNQTLQYLRQWLQEHQAEACLESELESFRRFIKDLTGVYRENEKKQTEKATFEQNLNTGKHMLASAQEKTGKLHHTLATTEIKKQDLQATLTAQLNGQTLTDLENSSNNLPTLISLCEQQIQLATQYESLQKREQATSAAIKLNTNSLEMAREQLTHYQMQKQEAEAHLKDLQHLVELQIRIQSYEEERKLLQPSQACPLCGSEHHPFVQHQYQCRVSEAEEKRNAYQLYVTSFLEQVNQQATQVTTLETKILADTQQLEQVKTEITVVIQKFTQNNNDLPKPLAIENLAIIQSIVQRKKAEQEQLQRQIGQVRTLETEIKQVEQEQGQLREEILRLESEAAQTTEKLNSIKQLLYRIQAELEDLREQETNITEEAHSFLSQFNLTFNFKDSVALETDLVKRAQLYAQNTQQLQDLQLSQKQTETEFKNITQTLTEKKQALVEQEKLIAEQLAGLQALETERTQLFGTKQPIAERERLQRETEQKTLLVNTLRTEWQQTQQQLRLSQEQLLDREREQTRLTAEYEELTEQLHEKIQQQGISSVEALVQLFLSEEEAHQIETLQQQLQNSLISYTQLLKHTSDELQHELARNLTTETEDYLLEQVRFYDSKIGLINREIGQTEQLLQRDEELKNKHQALANQIEIQQKEFLRWDKLATLIGSADGKKFSKFAQGLTLARLVMLANRHLAKINQRYRILKSPEADLELQIVDTFQADVVRPVTTLSGGESFLVSLALALGLSDLAGRQAQINSLFIDEGFGTLDAETLDVAITSLENLQASGKMIGIISHVEALKERISTQIKVIKMAGGASKLKIVGHAADAYV